MSVRERIKRILRLETPFLLMCPALLWQTLFLYVPLFVLLFYSVSKSTAHWPFFTFTFEHYTRIFQIFSLHILGNSFGLALETTLICLLLAYPLAYYLVFKVKRLRMFYLLLVILPSWTSLIIQIYAWFFLLKKDGLLSQSLYHLGLISAPTHMLNNHFSMLVGMIYCYLPFMTLPIYAILEKIDRRLLEASADLGASRWVTIKRIIFPLSLSGVIAGFFLVFIPAFGEFAIPEFLGGSKKLFWGNVIVSKFLDYRDWHSGAAITYSGLLFTAKIILFFYLLIWVMRKVFMRGKTGGRNG